MATEAGEAVVGKFSLAAGAEPPPFAVALHGLRNAALESAIACLHAAQDAAYDLGRLHLQHLDAVVSAAPAIMGTPSLEEPEC